MDDDIDHIPVELDKQVRSPPCVSQQHGHPRNPQPILSASTEWDDMAAAGRDGEDQRNPAPGGRAEEDDLLYKKLRFILQ
jgi:hypothetical protein